MTLERMDSGNSYKISIVVVHPDIDPTQISKELELAAYAPYKPGSPRVLPNGKPLPGVATESRDCAFKAALWSFTFSFRAISTSVIQYRGSS